MNEPSEEQLITYEEIAQAAIEEMRTQEAERIRRKMQKAINEDALPLEELKLRHGQVWTLAELQQQFEIIGFGAPLVVVRRRVDNKLGTVIFQHAPRFYWGWAEDRV